MRRGEVWWADLKAPAGRRPVLILSRDSMPAGRGEITVAYLTTNSRGAAWEVALTPADDGVDQPCVVNLDSINTVPKSALKAMMCQLSQAKMDEVRDAIVAALDLH
jgi:mRNA interferase MazF